MKIQRRRNLESESGVLLEVIHPDGSRQRAKHRSVGITIATTQDAALRTTPSEDVQTWTIREAEDEGETVVARVHLTPNGTVRTWTPEAA